MSLKGLTHGFKEGDYIQCKTGIEYYKPLLKDKRYKITKISNYRKVDTKEDGSIMTLKVGYTFNTLFLKDLFYTKEEIRDAKLKSIGI